jgi:aspartate/methionine/tyrosine aminotransferase
MDSGMFKPLQLAAIKALSSGKDWFLNLEMTYGKRQIIAYDILRSLECSFDEDQSGMFVWAKVPNGDGVTFTDRLLQDYNVFLTPGIIFGEAGNDYIRLSLCASEDLLLAVKKRLL